MELGVSHPPFPHFPTHTTPCSYYTVTTACFQQQERQSSCDNFGSIWVAVMHSEGAAGGRNRVLLWREVAESVNLLASFFAAKGSV